MCRLVLNDKQAKGEQEKMPGCPEIGCNAPITAVARYGRVLKRRAIDVAEFKYAQHTRLRLNAANDAKKSASAVAQQLAALNGAQSFYWHAVMRCDCMGRCVSSCSALPATRGCVCSYLQ